VGPKAIGHVRRFATEGMRSTIDRVRLDDTTIAVCSRSECRTLDIEARL
jgi:hypothetical protein